MSMFKAPAAPALPAIPAPPVNGDVEANAAQEGVDAMRRAAAAKGRRSTIIGGFDSTQQPQLGGKTLLGG